MTDIELRKLKAEFPTALTVWYDQMHELPTGMLIETLLVHIRKSVLKVSLMDIDSTIKTIREEEKQDGDRETTE